MNIFCSKAIFLAFISKFHFCKTFFETFFCCCCCARFLSNDNLFKLSTVLDGTTIVDVINVIAGRMHCTVRDVRHIASTQNATHQRRWRLWQCDATRPSLSSATVSSLLSWWHTQNIQTIHIHLSEAADL